MFLTHHQQVVGIHVIQVAHVTPPGGQILSFIVSLDMQSCPLPHGVASELIKAGLPQVIDFFCFFFLFFLLTTKVHNYPLHLLLFNFSSHSLNFLFHPYSFYRSFVCFFQFCPSIIISYMFFFSFQSSFF